MSLLNALHSKTAEEKKELDERAAMSGMSTNNKCTMPEASELEIVGKLREAFKDQLEKKKAAGTHFEFLFGDLNFVRIIRGCDSDFEKAKKWLERFFKTFDDFPIDEWAKQSQDLIDAGTKVEGDVLTKFFGLDPETYKHLNFQFSSDAKAVNGDAVWYVPVCDYEKKALVDRGEEKWKNYMDSFRRVGIYTQALMDKDSKKDGVMRKYYAVLDFKDVSITGMMHKPYDDALDRDVAKFAEYTAAETLQSLMVVNAPWWLSSMYKVMTKLLPERLLAKVKIFAPEDPALYDIIASDVMQKCYAFRIGRSAGRTGEPKGTVEVKAGADFEYGMQVKQGQTISWKFSVDPDLRFAGIAYWIGEEVEDMDESSGGEILVPQATVTKDDGEVEGEIEVALDGIVTLRWDNYESMMTSKKLTYEVSLA